MKLFSSTSTLQQTFLVLFFCGFAISFGQDFSGNYIGTGINGNASLQLEFDGATYSGVMGFGRDAVYVEGELEGLELEGFFSFGEKVDGFFTAAKEANQILLYYAFLKPDGSVDETTVQEIIFFEQASDNPLESSPNSSQSINSASTTLSGELIQYGVLYSAGASLKSELVGLSFTVPNTGQAIYVAEQGFVFGHSGLLGGGVQLIALSSGNLSAIVTSLLSIDPETEQLIPLGNIEQTQESVRASFQYITEQGTAYKEIWAQQADYGQVVVLIATAFLQEAEQMSIFMTDIGNSFRFATPNLTGITELSASFAGVNFSKGSGGAGGEGVVSASNFSLDLCSSREYRIFEESVLSVTAEFGDRSSNAYSNSEEERFGSWAVGAYLMGTAILLNGQEGSFEYMEVLENQGALFLNDKPVQISPSQICQ